MRKQNLRFSERMALIREKNKSGEGIQPIKEKYLEKPEVTKPEPPKVTYEIKGASEKIKKFINFKI